MYHIVALLRFQILIGLKTFTYTYWKPPSQPNDNFNLSVSSLFSTEVTYQL